MDFYKDFDLYLTAVVDSIKRALYERHNDIFDRIDFYNDNIYLEPLLYAYLNQTDNKWLDCIIYGYSTEKQSKIKVFSNHEGVIFLPKIGYFITNKPDSTIVLNTDEDQYMLEYMGEALLYTFEPLLYLPNNIEILKYQHPLFEPFFINDNGVSTDLKISEVYKGHISHIKKALQILKECNRQHYNLLKKTLKRIMLYTAHEPNSFAVLGAHNMIFLNVNTWDNEMFFVDHLSHEGAHVTFNTITYESKYELFNVNYNAKFSEVSGRTGEHSSVYLRFHGLFTFFEITKSLKSCMVNKHLSAKNIHGARGRFAFQLKRFQTSLNGFEGLDIFKTEGQLWFNLFYKECLKLNNEHGEVKTQYNLSGQSYDFNSKVFEELNPIIGLQ